jgi:hypothetical protein
LSVRIPVALLLALAIAAGAGSVPVPPLEEGDAYGQIVTAAEAQRALVVRTACRVSFDGPPVGLVADVSPDASVGEGRGFALEALAPDAFRPGAAPLVPRTRGPPPPRA